MGRWAVELDQPRKFGARRWWKKNRGLGGALAKTQKVENEESEPGWYGPCPSGVEAKQHQGGLQSEHITGKGILFDHFGAQDQQNLWQTYHANFMGDWRCVNVKHSRLWAWVRWCWLRVCKGGVDNIPAGESYKAEGGKDDPKELVEVLLWSCMHGWEVIGQ